VIIRPHRADDYGATRHIYAAAFTRPENPESVPLEGLFEAVREAGDAIPELSFQRTERGQARRPRNRELGDRRDPRSYFRGPIGVLPEYQRLGIGSAGVDALFTAADAADVPMIVLPGSPSNYSRFGFRPVQELGVIPPEPSWREAIQLDP
jgi:putative acetyltransferase